MNYLDVTSELTKILGTKFIDNKQEEVKDIEGEIFSCNLIGVLFSANWGSPCRIFEKELIQVYNEVNEGEKVFEILHISFERKEEDFKKSIVTKPWKFYVYNDPKIKELIDHFQILTIPHFFPLNKKGEPISKNSRIELDEDGLNVVENWMTMI